MLEATISNSIIYQRCSKGDSVWLVWIVVVEMSDNSFEYFCMTSILSLLISTRLCLLLLMGGRGEH